MLLADIRKLKVKYPTREGHFNYLPRFHRFFFHTNNNSMLTYRVKSKYESVFGKKNLVAKRKP